MKDPAKAAKHFSEQLQAAGLQIQDIDGFIRLISGWEPKTDQEKRNQEISLNNLEDRAVLVQTVVKPHDEIIPISDESATAIIDAENTVEFFKKVDAALDHPVIGTGINDELDEPQDQTPSQEEREMLAAEQWEQAAQAAHVVVGDSAEQATLRSHLRPVVEEIVNDSFPNTQVHPDTIDSITDQIVGAVDYFNTNLRPSANGKRGVKGTRTCNQCGVLEAETLAKNPKYSFCKGICVFCYNKNRSKRNRSENEKPPMNSDEPIRINIDKIVIDSERIHTKGMTSGVILDTSNNVIPSELP